MPLLLEISTVNGRFSTSASSESFISGTDGEVLSSPVPSLVCTAGPVAVCCRDVQCAAVITESVDDDLEDWNPPVVISGFTMASTTVK